MAESGMIPHALLFSGEEGIGKKKAAFELASNVLGCEIEKIEREGHPDLLLMEPLSNKGRGEKIQKPEIKISEVRKVGRFFSLGTFSSSFKVAIINDAHLMRKDAQSSFLKVLEEPKGNALFILISSLPKTLLPTISSRVQEVKFYRVSDEEISSYLKKKGLLQEKIDDIVSLSQGKPGKVFKFVSEPEKIREEKRKIKEILRMVKSDIKTRFEYAESISKNPEEVKETLELWIEHFRRALIRKAKGKSSGKYSIEEVEKILKLIQQIKKIISTTNASPRLALEILMIEL